MQRGSIADASGHECVMPGAKHCFQCKPIIFLLATPKKDTGKLTRHQCNAFCRGKCFSSFTCKKYLRSHSAHALEVGKKVIYPLVRDAQAWKKDVSNGYQYKYPMHLGNDEMQCKTEVTNTSRTKFSNQNYLQKLFKIQPQSVQMASNIHSGGLWEAKLKRRRF